MSSNQLEMVESTPSQGAEGCSPELQHTQGLPARGDAQRERGAWRCLPPAASIIPFIPGQLWAAGLAPRADSLQALGQRGEISSVVALHVGTSLLASRQLGHQQAHTKYSWQGGAEHHPPRAKAPPGQVPLLALPRVRQKAAGKVWLPPAFPFPDESVLLQNSGCHPGWCRYHLDGEAPSCCTGSSPY